MATVDELFTAIKENNQQLAIDNINQLSDEQLIIKNNDGWTPLHFAIKNGHHDVVMTLVERLSDEHLAIKNMDGYTPLHFATGQHDVVYNSLSR